MPKDEFDFDDPLELNGVAFLTEEDTTDAMCECFIEEFMRMGYNHKQVFALFRNPHYLGVNMVLEKRGEQFVRDQISQIFSRWGRPFAWPKAKESELGALPESKGEPITFSVTAIRACSPPADDFEASAIDPMGNPIPKLQ